jgi:hypothetical protein
MSLAIDTDVWAQEQFGNCDLGDVRLTRRLVQVAEKVANHPAASFPAQFAEWRELKAAYRLFDNEGATFSAIAAPHWQRTRAVGAGVYLVLGDTTEVDFGFRRDVPGLSQIGNGNGTGFLLHNALLVEARQQRLLGVAGQTIHYRQTVPKQEKRADRLKRQRESHVWGNVINQVGQPSAGVQLIHVLDRAADDFEVFCHLCANRADWVVRASSLHRQILKPDGAGCTTKEYLPILPLSGTYQLNLRARPGQATRTAKLEVRCGKFTMPLPHCQKSPELQQLTTRPIEMTVVWVREIGAPPSVKAIEWVLYTSLKVPHFNAAWKIIEYYECRWLIEEYHKALKTGCSVEDRELRTAGRLEAVVGLMSIVAVRLLQLKSMARDEPQRPASTIIPPVWLKMLQLARKSKRSCRDLTISEFYRELAKLGGFLGRSHDGNPGWITLWRGWERLHNYVEAAQLLKRCG